MHKIDSNTTALMISFNYPSKLLAYRSRARIVEYNDEMKFIISSSDVLIESKTNMRYKRRHRKYLYTKNQN